MTNRWLSLAFLFCLAILGQGNRVISDTVFLEKKQFTILKTSELFLTGTTNVNTFKCDCEDYFPPQTFSAVKNGNTASFKNARIKMRTRKFNCKNPKMNRDMHKALKADKFPQIKIALVETRFNSEQLKNGNTDHWYDVRAKVHLTITDVRRTQIIQAKYQKQSKNRFTLRGAKSLKMTDYGIDPPEALFGLIKVDDEITFNFNLDVAVEDIVQ